ncbi:MAG: HEAT repeat domain-containing protein [Planctomycetota bacterium]
MVLGIIGDERARVPLEQKVRDPNSLIQFDAVRALGALHDPRSLPVLAEALRHANPLIRGQAALALGEFMDEAVYRALADAFAAETDSFVRECMYDSLAHFGSGGFVPDLVRDLATTANPLARRHLAMIAGRYIEGRDDAFYKTLSLETQEQGSGGQQRLERMLKRVRRLEIAEDIRAELAASVERLRDLFWAGRHGESAALICELFRRYVGILPGAGDEKRALFVLELIGRQAGTVVADNREFTLLALYAFYRLIAKTAED